MPQLDIDIFDDFLFFAFVSLMFGVGDDEGEQSVVDTSTDAFLANFYIQNTQKLIEEEILIKIAFERSILIKNNKN
jgi:hypothetical protein